ncbi:hypothetical protein DFQ28_011297 [Apophysomyces sp. BC1034]|nr:hypothetical protein DFQ30_011025 [Apophysomyces sp. BC1015]KAG0168939.1 hypothetical protein DFQ29_009967 [Apophysomyces sp. BC1021]KAG0184382.1 hypothetical protein DFQ28_011297 [Apophysomyces sp. BC1034]
MDSSQTEPDSPISNKKKIPKSIAAGSKRMKIQRACDECRKRKVKCDGAQPCLRCRKSDAQCVFVKLPPKRGPPKQYIENLEARLQLVEKALRSMNGPARQIFDEALAHETQKLGLQDEEEDEEPEPNVLAEHLTTSAQFAINEIGQALYVNDSQTRIDRVPTVQRLISHPTSDQAVAEIPISQRLSSVHIMHEIPSALIDVYFAHVHKYTPMIHKPMFLKQMHSRTNPPSKLLLYAMCAVAERWADQPPTDTSLPPGFTYYQGAFALLDDFSDAPRVSTIQALVLLIKYQETYRRAGFFCRPGLYLSMAVQMCNELGLSRLEGGNNESCEVEGQKRTFWMTYIYDLMMSIEQGREPFFDHTQCTTEFPLVTGEEGPALEELIANHNILIQLIKVLSPIYLMSRRVAARHGKYARVVVEEQSRLFVLNTHLENLLHEIPPSLMYPPTQDVPRYPAEKHPVNDSFVGFLHMSYHFSVILLHRHYVIEPFPETEHEIQPYDHRILCSCSASNITNIAETLLENQLIDVFFYPVRGVQHTIHCVAMAATVHRYEMTVAQDQASADTAKQQYLKSLNILNRLAPLSPAVEFHSHIKEAELAQLYGQMVVVDSQMPEVSSSSPFPVSNSHTAPLKQQIDRVADPPSATPSPVPSPNVRTNRAMKVPKTRRHTLTGAPQLMQMTLPMQTAPTIDVPMNPEVALYNSSASLTDPARLASMLQQGIQMYGQTMVRPPNYMDQRGCLRRSRRGNTVHNSYSQEDLRAMRRMHMTKPAVSKPTSNPMVQQRSLHRSTSMYFPPTNSFQTDAAPPSAVTSFAEEQQRMQLRRHTISTPPPPSMTATGLYDNDLAMDNAYFSEQMATESSKAKMSFGSPSDQMMLDDSLSFPEDTTMSQLLLSENPLKWSLAHDNASDHSLMQ